MAYTSYFYKKVLYSPQSNEVFKLSRSKIDLFVECPRCFYMDRRLGVSRPQGFPFTLNSAVDTLLKKEFDILRAKGESHELMKAYGLDAVPFKHAKMNEWRENFTGVQALHRPTKFLIFGAVDDLWVTPDNEIIVVDYKSTAMNKEITLDEEWKDGYKRQMEVYQWLVRQNGFKVAETGYFVYANGRVDRPSFDAKLEFDITLLPYKGNTDWIEPKLLEIKNCLDSDKIPSASPTCEYCKYANERLPYDAPAAKTKQADLFT